MPLHLAALHLTEGTVGDWVRNIVSLRESENLYDDLTDDPAIQEAASLLEMGTKPEFTAPPIIRRPFEEAEQLDAVAQVIGWPFEHPAESRYSAGRFGVWYGAVDELTTVHETVYHWRRFVEDSAASEAETDLSVHRRLYRVACLAPMLDLRPHLNDHPELLDPDSYHACQRLGATLHSSHQPGLVTRSVRYAAGAVLASFTPEVLENPRVICFLTYRWNREADNVVVERERGRSWVEI